MKFKEKTCFETVYITPKHLIDIVAKYFDGEIPCDPATEPSNPAGAKLFYTKEDNGLLKKWPEEGAFVNPPYGTKIRDWTLKIKNEALMGKEIIALFPCGARFSTKYWQENALCSQLNALCFVNKRISFLTKDGTPAKRNIYDSAFYGYNVDQDKFKNLFSCLGKTFSLY